MGVFRTGLTGMMVCTVAVAAGAVGCAAPSGGSASSAAAAAPSVVSAPAAESAAGATPDRRGASSRGPSEGFDYFGGLRFDAAVPSPKEALGYEIGERFTRHGDMVRCIEALAEASDRVQVEKYGASHLGRSLHVMTISSPRNLARLEEILAANRELTDPRNVSAARAREIAEGNPAIAWLSYNVHGNEASCTDAALQVAYTLAAGQNPEILDILDNVVVVIDPLMNPDGRERYVNWYDGVSSPYGALENPDAAEHDEPWPGGRTNHYYFDLNRDWLWLVHPESRSRLAMYKRSMPHLHIDYHEQEYRSPYFFGAGEDPYNLNIAPETREWVERYGAANAEVFERELRVYSTRERFDYLYPGYGKVLPCYQGAVGMLCEKGGHGRAGLAIKVTDQHTLTLFERARDHFLTSMSYLEFTSENRRGQIERFARYFAESMTPPDGEAKSFVISAENDPALLEKVWSLCAAQGIEIHATERAANLSELVDYRTGEAMSGVEVPAGSWVIESGQPLGRLARAIFERDTKVTDKQTYDISSWSIPVVFGLEAWESRAAVDAPVRRLTDWRRPAAEASGVERDGAPYALLIDAGQHRLPRGAALLVEREIVARFAGEPFEIDGQAFGQGTLIVHAAANPERDLNALARDLSAAGVRSHRVGTGFSTAGYVLGANNNRALVAPKVLLVRGEGTNSYSYGAHWHLIDVESPMPHTPVNASSLRGVDLDEYNVIVIPDAGGGLEEQFGQRGVERLKEWVRGGGALVATGGAATWANRAILEIKPDEKAKEKAEKEEEKRPDLKELTFKERRERAVEDNVPGPTMRATVDVTHPLAAGVREWVGVVKDATEPMALKDDAYVVAKFEENGRIGGYISERNQGRLAGSPFVTHHGLGSGVVICFSDDVTPRGFMHAGMRMLLNAMVYGPSL